MRITFGKYQWMKPGTSLSPCRAPPAPSSALLGTAERTTSTNTKPAGFLNISSMLEEALKTTTKSWTSSTLKFQTSL